jgi:hypothetical protein
MIIPQSPKPVAPDLHSPQKQTHPNKKLVGERIFDTFPFWFALGLPNLIQI